VLLKELNIPTNGAHVVIIGRSNIVGKPLANLFTRRSVNATVTVCHTGTRDLAEHTRRADILIAAAGKPGLVTANMVKNGAVVIDVGSIGWRTGPPKGDTAWWGTWTSTP